jgi:adenosine/AMP kinase
VNARQTAGYARRQLEFAETFEDVPGEERAVIRALLPAVRQLLAVVEAQDRSVRLAAQHDEEFRNLAAGARSEILRLHCAIKRLDPLAEALTRLLTDAASE